MKNKLPCEIIRDLLPSYVDGLTSEVTNEAICEHIQSCDACKETLHRMQAPEEIESAEEHPNTNGILCICSPCDHR